MKFERKDADVNDNFWTPLGTGQRVQIHSGRLYVEPKSEGLAGLVEKGWYE
jgi:hypothetical protein